ncbi:four helix bundle protein [uncultured Bacteroides sp.]|uniref:four helix bundle protein n=1 Tax=uncultured Bacteroides sp. TaxID=162156 RepID=UPI0025E8B2C9|nr:four helix bundle protein [uncultured Bacteroides sp.]
MATYNQLPVYKATYDLLLYLYQVGRDVQRDYRYTLGETLKKDLVAILVLIYRANTTRQKVETIAEAREKLVAVKLQMRLLHDLKQISLKAYADASLMAESISKQLVAWQKAYEGKSSAV